MAEKELAWLCFIVCFTSVATLSFEKPISHTVWPQTCSSQDVMLNDCNWCRCSKKYKFVCTARVCNEVDMFGHFKDAIRDINVGMEGKGSWRSTETPCQAGVQYEREGLLCVCTEEGVWPNPVCRDSFRFLHQVEVSAQNDLEVKSQKCQATKLYVIGCNVCFCPSTGHLDPKLCTTRNCTTDDPLTYPEKKLVERNGDDNPEILEIYAQCEVHNRYKFGCRTCMCLRNNRLICDECPEEGVPKAVPKEGTETHCDSFKPGEIFSMGCNLCVCDKNKFLYCSAKNCLKKDKTMELPSIKKNEFKLVSAPYDDVDCVPDTRYEKDCNVCFCTQSLDGVKSYTCTVKTCANSKNVIDTVRKDCVPQTCYESNCQICICAVLLDVKVELCQINPACVLFTKTRTTDVAKLHGYCEPLHNYQNECNACRCQQDGKTFKCTAQYCDKKQKKEPLLVDIVPITQTKEGAPCPNDHMYKVDCNVCFCLSNGHILCTTADCKKNKK